MATTKFTKNVPKKTPKKDIEDAGAPEPPRGKRSPSKGARGQRADTSDSDIRHKTRGTGKSATGVKRTRSKNPGAVAEEIEATLRPDRDGETAKRNAKRRAPKAGVALEGSDDGTPSRKSSRAGANRLKQGTELTKAAQRASRSPEKRAERAAASGRSGGKGAKGGKAAISRGRGK
jgi:hypothetical protein